MIKNYKLFLESNGDVEKEKMIAILKEECSEAIALFKEVGFFYRGVIYPNENYVTRDLSFKIPRKDRRPKDTNIDTSEFIDDIFEEKFGIRLRSNSVFASTDVGIAEGYTDDSLYDGSIYIIFPVNGFDYYTSNKINDLYSMIEDCYWYDYNKFLNPYEYFYNSYFGDFYCDNTKIDIRKKITNTHPEKYKYLNDLYPIYRYGSQKKIIDYIINNIELFPSMSYEDNILFFEEHDIVTEINIAKFITWVPDLTRDEFEKIRKEKVREIVDGYTKNDKSSISSNEISIICDKYYCVKFQYSNTIISISDLI